MCPLLRFWDQKLNGYQSQSQVWNANSARKKEASERVRESADTSVVKKKTKRNPMTEQKRRPENTKIWKKVKEALNTNGLRAQRLHHHHTIIVEKIGPT